SRPAIAMPKGAPPRPAWPHLRRGSGRPADCATGRARAHAGPNRADRRCAGERMRRATRATAGRSEEHTSELQSLTNLVCRLLLEKKKNQLLRVKTATLALA